ncbi:MAG TPA: hypothetical protein VGC70_14065, partial [Burkholderiales bacterium]
MYSIALAAASAIVSGAVDVYFAYDEARSVSISLQRTGIVLLAGIALALLGSVFLARRFVGRVNPMTSDARQFTELRRADV